jgi:hypothetical protein
MRLCCVFVVCGCVVLMGLSRGQEAVACPNPEGACAWQISGVEGQYCGEEGTCANGVTLDCFEQSEMWDYEYTCCGECPKWNEACAEGDPKEGAQVFLIVREITDCTCSGTECVADFETERVVRAWFNVCSCVNVVT